MKINLITNYDGVEIVILSAIGFIIIKSRNSSLLVDSTSICFLTIPIVYLYFKIALLNIYPDESVLPPNQPIG